MDRNNSKTIEERVEMLEKEIEQLHDAVARLNADLYGQEADEDETPKRIDFSEAYGKTGGLVYHPDDVKA